MSTHRIEKMNELIRQKIGELLMREVSFKAGVLVTTSKVDTTPDFRYTRIFLSVYPEKEANYVIKTLQNEIFDIQGKLNKALQVRPLPRIQFMVDETEIEADKVEKLLEQIHSEKGEK
jgi:ribosome-binding factor A